MASNSIFFTIGADASKGVASLKQFQSAVNDTSKQIQTAFGTKLKQIISFAAIEEGVRRTAEWAQEIRQTSQALGVTAEQLQTLQIIASKTGTSESAVISMFENIQKARDEALKGNTDLMMSFSKLGVSMADLASLDTSKLFGKVMDNIPDNIRNNPDMFLRQSVQNVTGTPENVLASFKAGLPDPSNGASGFEGATSGLLKSGDIGSNAEIQQISAIWAEIKTGLKEAGTQLLPIVKVLLGFVQTFVDAIGGVAELIKHVFNLIKDTISGEFSKAGEDLKGVGRIIFSFVMGVTKVFTSLLDIFVNLGNKFEAMVDKLMPNWAKKLREKITPEWAKKYAISGEDFKNESKTPLTDWLNDQTKIMNKAFGISEGTAKRGQGLGEAATLVASMGRGTTAKIGASITNNAAGVAEKIGLTGVSEKLSFFGKKLEDIVTKEQVARFKATPGAAEALALEGTAARNKILLAQGEETLRFMDARGLRVEGTNVFKRNAVTGEETLLTPEQAAGYDSELGKNLQGISDNITAEARANFLKKFNRPFYGALVTAGGVGVMNAQNSIYDARRSGNIVPKATTPIVPWNAPGFTMDSLNGGGANVRIGGMFGSGEMKIIRLNEQMVRLLSMIQVNTSYYQSSNLIQNSPTGGMGGNAGGL